MIFKVPITWQMWGYYLVEAPTLKDAIVKIRNDELPEGRYIDDSAEIDIDGLREYNRDAAELTNTDIEKIYAGD